MIGVDRELNVNPSWLQVLRKSLVELKVKPRDKFRFALSHCLAKLAAVRDCPKVEFRARG
jgi:hypothetical protein